MSGFIERRRALRSKIRSNELLDRRLHIFATLVLVLDITVILYTLVSVTARMTLSGLGLLDSLPIVLYILPLLIVLPLLVRGYYRDRFALFNFIILVISSVFFTVLSVLVRGFAIILVFNILAVAIVFVMGRYRPKTSIRKIDRKGWAIFLFFNILGLMFPLTTFAMGQNAIAWVEPTGQATVLLDVPLADFDFPFRNVTPDSTTLQGLSAYGFGVNLRVLEGNPQSWANLTDWLVALNGTEIDYVITMTSPRGSYVGSDTNRIGSTTILQSVYESHLTAFQTLTQDLEDLNITRLPEIVYFDMTLSPIEWEALMDATRGLNIPAFSSLLRYSIDSTDPTILDAAAVTLADETNNANLASGVLIESFILDDLSDGDSGAMLVCGQTMETLQLWDHVEVLCSRSSYSYEMLSDVGEYLTHSFSSSLSQRGGSWSIRLGTVGNEFDIRGRQNEVYNTLEVVAEDVAIASGNGVSRVTLESLPLLLSSFGSSALADLSTSISGVTRVGITYTFRIYAFRAVFIAIDSFDPIML